MDGNPTRHVLIALALTAIVFIVGGAGWQSNIAKIKPVTIKQRGT